MNETKDAAPPRAKRPADDAPPPVDPGHDRARARTGELVDVALLAEITLLSEVIANVAGYPSHLKGDEVDDVLGLD